MMTLFFYSLFVVITLPILYVRNRLSAFFYGALFLYSFFAILGYLYFPGYSESIGAYFGDWVGYSATWFTFGSMVMYFIFNMWLYKHNTSISESKLNISVIDTITPIRVFPIYVVIGIYIFGLFYTFNDLSWYLAERDEIPIEIQLVIVLFKTCIGFLLFMYVCVRENSKKFFPFYVPMTILFLVTIVTALKLGNRTDVVAIVLGIAYYESSIRRLSARLIVGAMVFLGVAGAAISVIELFRYDQPVVISSISEKLIMNDYFPPAHMLFASIAYNFVDAYEVFQSNLSNAAMFLKYPFLQQTVTNLFNADISTRTASYAFYIFTEGFLVLGFYGIFYNAIFLSLLMKIWNSLICTNNRLINLLIGTLMASMIINITRGQSSYFIKYIYLYFLPTVVLAIVVLGIKLVSKDGRRRLAPL